MSQSTTSADERRKALLAAALRENLKRRKAQARARQDVLATTALPETQAITPDASLAEASLANAALVPGVKA